MTRGQIGRLHIITDVVLQQNWTHAELAEFAVAGGADVVQFRDKRALDTVELQAMAEEVYFLPLNHIAETHPSRNLCLAGGCAYNSVANGKIFAKTPYEELHIHPAAGDAGTAVGAAYWVWHQELTSLTKLLLSRRPAPVRQLPFCNSPRLRFLTPLPWRSLFP